MVVAVALALLVALGVTAGWVSVVAVVAVGIKVAMSNFQSLPKLKVRISV